MAITDYTRWVRTQLVFPRHEELLARFITSEMLIDMGVPLHMREEFWCKYGPELVIPEDNLNSVIEGCTTLYAIFYYLLDRRATGRYQYKSGADRFIVHIP